MPSITVENYVKQLYLEQRPHPGQLVPMGRLAASMNVTPGTATSMVKALHEAQLVDYEPRSGARLTPQGEKVALRVLRRHRLVELFLVEVLGLDWSEVHEEAEELEHAISEKVLDRLDAYLGYPAHDPHGDPIPTASGKIRHAEVVDLTQCRLNQPVRIARILDQSAAFLQFMERSGLMPGTPVVAEARDEVADAVRVKPLHGPAVTLGTAAAAKILVEETDEEGTA